MALKINSIVFGLCVLGVFGTIVECRMREIFGARCQAQCLAKTFGSNCTGTCYTACVKPCKDHEEFYKVKSCKKYCSDIGLKVDNWQCRSSCKYLLKLYNTGVKSGMCQTINDTQSCSTTSCIHDNECPYLEKCCQQSAACGKTCQKPLLNITGHPSTPTNVNSTFIKKPRSVVIKWSYKPHYPRSQSRKPVVFIVEVRQVSVGSQQGVVTGEWNYLNTTNQPQLTLYPRSNTWSEYRVIAVNEQGTSKYSTQSSPMYIPPERPTPPRNFRVYKMSAVKSKVRMELVWSKPEKSEIKIHRYRIFWSKRLDSHTKELMSLRVHHKRIPPDQHSAIINGLTFNTTYVLEIQAICRYNGQRLRSDRVYLTARTMEKEKTQKKEVLHNKKDKVYRNSFKKPEEKTKIKPKLSGGTLLTPTVSSDNVRRPENATTRGPTEASVRDTSSGNEVHSSLVYIICLLLFQALYW